MRKPLFILCLALLAMSYLVDARMLDARESGWRIDQLGFSMTYLPHVEAACDPSLAYEKPPSLHLTSDDTPDITNIGLAGLL